MLNKSKYSTWYTSIIERAKAREIQKPFEKHHIIPKSCGGTDDIDNIVKLTLREHLICHLLLTKALISEDHTSKMIKAFFYMCRRRKISSRIYETTKVKFLQSIVGINRSDDTKRKISEKLKGKSNGWQGRTHAEVAKIKMSESAKTRKRSPVTDETKARISKAKKGRKMSEEHRLKRIGEKRSKEARFNMSQAQLGKKLSEETKAKQSLALKGRKFSPEHLAKLKISAQNRSKKCQKT